MHFVPEDILDKYELVVGLEIHIQLNTATKIFSTDSAAFGAGPNEHTSPVSLGLPGTLPFLNKKAVSHAVKMGLSTGCSINLVNRFDRKNYFYADLPKGYQITQDDAPICKDGYLELTGKDKASFRVRINRIHLEEDAGKSLHDKDDHYSLIDLNRAGVPLIELVTEPDIRSAEQAATVLTEIRKIARYIDVSDGNMEEGSMRCDANISVRKRGAAEYGNRCEVKNLNSIRNLQRAITYEYRRQVSVLEDGGCIGQNTLSFDALTGATSVLRSKEMAYDYRYFPEPDLQPLQLSEKWVEELERSLPILPKERIKQYRSDFGLSEYDAALITMERPVAEYFEELVALTENYKSAANWIIGPIQSWLNEQNAGITAFPLKAGAIQEIIALVDAGKINHSAAVQQLFPALLAQPGKSIAVHLTDLDLLIDTGDGEIDNCIDQVLSKYPDKIVEYHKGKKGVIGLFMGEVMKMTAGKIDASKTNRILTEKLENLK